MPEQNAQKIPRACKLVSEIVAALEALGGSASSKKITNCVIERLDLPRDVIMKPRNSLTDKRTDLEYQIAWAKTYAKLQNKIEKLPNGNWTVVR